MTSALKALKRIFTGPGVVLFALLLAIAPLMAQDPWSTAAGRTAGVFTGAIARGFSLVAIVVGGLSLAFSEGGGKRSLGGLIFGLGMALGATQFMTWLFG
jgi:type IV secretory pathway VirB2 component (pilin)